MAYYVEGKTSTKADLVKLVLNVNNTATRREGLVALADAADALFATTSFEPPGSMRDKVLAAQRFESEAGATIVRFVKEQSRIATYRLEIEDAEVIRRRKLLAEGSAGLFRLCKAAIEKDLNYTKALTGDGEPIEEVGYLSFMIEGVGGDMYFCEAYPDGKYKIKAVYEGKYPFRYVASGSFD